MAVSAQRSSLGRHVFGMAALASGLVTLAWPNYEDWDQLRSILSATDGPIVLYAAAAAQIVGGVAIQFRPTAKAGAAVLGAVYLVLALSFVPRIVAGPQIYDRWGNLLEQLSLVTGAAIVYARSSSAWTPETLGRIGRMLFGVCTVSFAIEQAIHLEFTASLVPKWLPPGQMFWTVSTTVAFALAAVALLTNCTALLATRLLTLMLVIFGLLVWVPLVFAHPNSHANWSELTETFAIAGAAWILADLLGEHRLDTATRRTSS
jgi:hypothetical protein